ncbi:MAG: SEL1-like repeat protein [Roseiarcus sp.]
MTARTFAPVTILSRRRPETLSGSTTWPACRATARESRWTTPNRFAPAEFNLGDTYGRGLGVLQDKQQATEWYRQAANQGHIAAQSRLDALANPGRAESGVWSYLAHVCRLEEAMGELDVAPETGAEQIER